MPSQGRTLKLSEPRRFINDLTHFARHVPTIPVARVIDISALVGPREVHPARPSWAVLFMKAFGIVSAEHRELRRCLLTFPWTRIYEHDESGCALAVERNYQGEDGIFVGLFRAPEGQTLFELVEGVTFYKDQPIESVGFFRQAIRISRLPTLFRRFLWWSTLAVSGSKRAKRFGTFGLSTYGSLGAESLHPISPLTITLTYGPIDESGRVTVKLIYDHRVLDGAFIARRLADVEKALNGPVLDELREARVISRRPAGDPMRMMGPRAGNRPVSTS